MQPPAWIVILSALLTPTIGIMAIYIAFQQLQANRNKLKFELFEKRYVYYETAVELVSGICGSGRATSERTTAFLMATKGAQFIIGKEIAAYFDNELYKQAVRLNALDSEIEGLPPGEERSANVQRQRELKEWFSAQHAVLDAKFAPLLRLKH